ncbi:ABC transporter substrate-binding protein [Paenibacillus tarimensis]|uniref:ABC transporter substrate-binding protein n=1 Tax=Paenibacillus tarimensis TaxID=416012 RepID=UPI001F1A6B18|nr:ABC transporter substrate-binding protein [Paenibacillus tarimensis]MCF2943384.1 ABC transporter substrate-binding protein [Paenibacillus tarimensis]
MRRFLTAIIPVLLAIGLAGCAETEQQEPVTLKVLTWSEQYFNQNYGDLFTAKNSEYDLQVTSLSERLEPGEDLNQAVEKAVEEVNPDLLALNMDYYLHLREQGKLATLTDWMNKDDINLNEFMPAVVSYLKDDQQELHGLTASFTGSALYYNKRLFREKGIPYPQGTMTWDEVFKLADSFTKMGTDQGRTYGFVSKESAYPFMMALKIGEASGLNFFRSHTFTFNTPAWEKVFAQVLTCHSNKTCYAAMPDTTMKTNIVEQEKETYPFLKDHVAMAVDSSDLYRVLTYNEKRYEGLDWGVLPMPVSNEQPDTGSGISISHVFSIPAQAKHKDQAWEFIRYISSEEYAKTMSSVNPYELPIRTGEEQNEEINVFYNMKAINNSLNRTLRRLPAEVIMEMDEVTEKYVTAFLEKELSLSDALNRMNDELQSLYDQSEGLE